MDYRIDIIDRETCFRGFLSLVRYRLRHRLFSGGWSRPLTRERLEGLRAAAVVLYDPLLDRVVLVEQFRIGGLESGTGAWMLEPVGGVVGPGEDPAEVVRREVREEAGCEVLALEPIGALHVAPGVSDEQLTLFCGRVDAVRARGIHGLGDEGEETRVVAIDVAQVAKELFSGRINNSAAIICIQWLIANRARLSSAWGEQAAAYVDLPRTSEV
jgi:ADP-ribose pyrophosphatase